MRYGIVVILLLGLVACAAGAEDTPPIFPHVFYGSVTIAGSPAPVGTVITAKINDMGCGSVQTVDAGRYGDSDRNLMGRLAVMATSGQEGKTISFFVNGVAAQETATFTSGAVTALDLTAAAGESIPTTPTPSDGGGSTPGGSSKSPGSDVKYDPGTPAAPKVFSGHAPLATSAAGVVIESVMVRSNDEKGAVTISEGTVALDSAGGALGEVTCSEVAPADVPAAPPGTTVAVALSCGPAGATFNPPAVLTYTLSAEEWAKIGEGATLKVMWYNPEAGGWQEITATVNSATRTITAEVSHFSIYALVWATQEKVAAGAEGTAAPGGDAAGGSGPALPVWALVIVLVLIVALAAFFIMKKR